MPFTEVSFDLLPKDIRDKIERSLDKKPNFVLKRIAKKYPIQKIDMHQCMNLADVYRSYYAKSLLLKKIK